MIIFDRWLGTFEAEPNRLAIAKAAGAALRPWETYDPNYGLSEQMGTFNGVRMNLIGLQKLLRIMHRTSAGLFARRWGGGASGVRGSGNSMGEATPPLRRPRYDGYAGGVRGEGAGMRKLYLRNSAAFGLTMSSLALQFVAKGRGLSETALLALVGWALVHVAGECLDAPKYAKRA